MDLMRSESTCSGKERLKDKFWPSHGIKVRLGDLFESLASISPAEPYRGMWLELA